MKTELCEVWYDKFLAMVIFWIFLLKLGVQKYTPPGGSAKYTQNRSWVFQHETKNSAMPKSHSNLHYTIE